LFEVVIEVMGFAEDVIEIAVVDVHVVADLAPVKARGLRRHEPAKDDDDDQKNPSGADTARWHPIPLGLLVFNQLQDPPQNQQQRPVVREQSPQARPGQHVQIAEQEDDSEDNQHHGPSEGTTMTAWRNRRLHGVLNRTRHCAPRRKKMPVLSPKTEAESVATAALRQGARAAADQRVQPMKRYS